MIANSASSEEMTTGNTRGDAENGDGEMTIAGGSLSATNGTTAATAAENPVALVADTNTGSFSSNISQYKLMDDLSWRERMWDITTNFAYMSVTAFGGPAYAVTLLNKRFVSEKKWLDEKMFKELFSLVQGFPGPTQGLMALTIGTVRGGFLGGLWALSIYAFPGFLVMTGFGLISFYLFDASQPTPDWMIGLGASAIPMVFIAVHKLGVKMIADSKLKILLATFSCVSCVCVCVCVERRGGEDD